MDTEALVSSNLANPDTPSSTHHTIAEVGSFSQLAGRSKLVMADPGPISNRSSHYNAQYEVENIRTKMHHAKLPSPSSVNDEHSTRQDGQGHQDMDLERSLAA